MAAQALTEPVKDTKVEYRNAPKDIYKDVPKDVSSGDSFAPTATQADTSKAALGSGHARELPNKSNAQEVSSDANLAKEAKASEQRSLLERITSALGLNKEEKDNIKASTEKDNVGGKAISLDKIADTTKKVTGHEMNDLSKLDKATLAAAANIGGELKNSGGSMAAATHDKAQAPVLNVALNQQGTSQSATV